MKKNLIDSILTISNTEICFNRNQWSLYKKGEITLAEIKLLNKCDVEIGKLGKRAYNILLFMLAGAIGAIEYYKNTLTVNCFTPLDSIDSLGNTFLGIFQRLGKWVTLIMAFIEIIRAVMKGSSNTSEMFGIIFKYVLIYATMFLIPYLFDIVAGAF